MIYLVTGMPGNGKTLYAVDFIDRAVKAGRAVYSDIEGLKIEGVLPAPDDWRTVPDGALIVYDEAHRRFPAYKGKGRSPLEIVQEMDTHRHRGIDMMMITQWPDKIDGELFRLVGKHFHLNRAMGLQRASLVSFSRGVPNPYSRLSRKGADEEIWEYPKRLYDLYASSSMHTDAHKFKLPSKVKHALISVPFIVLALWGFYAFAMNMVKPKAERSEAETTPQARQSITSAIAPQLPQHVEIATLPGTGAYDLLNIQPAPTLAGCVASGDGADANGEHRQGSCRCFNTDGYQIDMSRQHCEEVLTMRMPFNVYHQYVTGSASIAQESKETRRDESENLPMDHAGAVGSAPRPTVDPAYGQMTRPVM